MTQTIKCSNCGQEIEVSEALTHQLEEQITSDIENRHKKELDQFKQDLEKKASKELEEQAERNKKLAKQVDELLDEIRALRRRDEERELEMKKRLVSEEEKIRQEAAKKSDEEHKLKDLEKDKKITDLMNALEDAQKKAAQGSQQTQGEILELEIEQKLRLEFPADLIAEVKKGQRGADVIHTIIDRLNHECGNILWESKNAKWSDTWIAKLKEDKRQVKADLAALVSVDLPKGIETFTYISGVWIVGWKHFISLAYALRYNIISNHGERQKAQGKEEKKEMMYRYLTGNEFKDKVEGILESYNSLRADIEREKRWYQAKWARQEKEIGRIIGNTTGMYGDLKGLMGNSLPEIKTLELADGES